MHASKHANVTPSHPAVASPKSRARTVATFPLCTATDMHCRRYLRLEMEVGGRRWEEESTTTPVVLQRLGQLYRSSAC